MPDIESLLDLEDAELFSKLEQAGLAVALEQDPKWKLLAECLSRLSRKMADKLSTCDPTNLRTVIECQMTINFCNKIIPSILKTARDAGEVAFNELVDRGSIPSAEPDEK